MRVTCRISFFVMLFLSGCASAPEVPVEVTRSEMVNRDRVVGGQLGNGLETHLHFIKDTETLVYLRELASVLVNATPDLRGAPVGIWLVKNHKGKRWISYSLPGNRIYLSLGALKSLSFENEAVSLIAIELGHILRSHVVRQIRKAEADQRSTPLGGLLASQFGEKLSHANYFGPTGIFAYPEEFDIEAMQTAVDILYRSGYDGRGLISLLDRLKKNPAYSPYESSTIDKLVEQVRYEITMNTPLRNPIVTTERFITMRKRIENL